MPKSQHLTSTWKPDFRGVIQSECKHKHTIWQWLPPVERVWGFEKGLICTDCNDILVRSK